MGYLLLHNKATQNLVAKAPPFIIAHKSVDQLESSVELGQALTNWPPAEFVVPFQVS